VINVMQPKENISQMKTTVDNTPELHDALFHAICLLDHASPQTDTDHRDVAAARELRKLRDSLNQPTAKEITQRMIETAKAKNGGKLGGESDVDRRKFRRP
jgi:hypothetical protein